MSTSKKKTIVKASDPKAKYRVSQKVFAITYHKEKPEEIWEVEIIDVLTSEYVLTDQGKKIGTGISFSYTGQPKTLFPMRLMEAEIYQNYQEAAKVFSKAFTHMLK